jgi:curved DNA-binding protein CbpA
MPEPSGVDETTFYEALGVDEDASTAEVRAAYRERAKATHPDVSDAPDAGRRFRRIKRAHDVLTDERERRRYDRLGHEAYLADVHGPAESATREPRTDPSNGDGGPESRGGPGTASGDGTSADGAGRRGPGRGAASARPGAGGGRGAGAGSDGGHRGRERPGAGRRRRGATAGQGPFGRLSYGVARWLGLAGTLVAAWQSRLGPTGAAPALATFAAYPVFLAAAVTPLFPIGVNLLVGLCTVAMLGYLVVRPAVGVAVLGAWMLVLPFALTLSGVGVLSLGGLYALGATAVPLVLCLATLAGASV